jgi:energy-coupling factor transport system ATP-binding protein
LDEATIDNLRNYLAWLKSEGFTIVIAEHRLSYLMDSADHFLFLPEGIHWTKAELLAKEPVEVEQLGLRSLQPITIQSTEHNLATTSILNVENLRYRYPKQQNELTIPHLTLANDEIIGLVGKNGSGKSTLSQLLTGLLKPKQGKISYRGQKVSMRQLIKESYIVMQDVNLQLFFETVEKEITAKAQNLEAYDEVVSCLSLESLLQRHPQTLSGGEKQRVALAAAILSGKKILIFDEPTSGLDLERMKEVSQLIQWLQQKEVLIVIITHDKEFLQMTCQRMLEMDQGKIIADRKIIPKKTTL